MPLPDFLIIGAMKAGTTSLYRDLRLNPAIYLPDDKEPNNLLSDQVFTEPGRRGYADHFTRARPDQVCGEASTGYSKLPDNPGVPQRARRLLGPGVRAIYLVREPVARLISQHHHERLARRIPCGIDEAVRRHDRFVNYSRYAMQIEPWIEVLGAEQVRIIPFEQYVADRATWVTDISRFLDVEPCCEAIESDRIHNPSRGKPLPRGPIAALRSTELYRRTVRPLLSSSIRERLRHLLLPRAEGQPQPPARSTVAYIIDRLRDDVERLSGIMGLDRPLWDLEDVAAGLAAGEPDPGDGGLGI